MDNDEKLAIKLFWWLPVLTFLIGVSFGWMMLNPKITIVNQSGKIDQSIWDIAKKHGGNIS